MTEEERLLQNKHKNGKCENDVLSSIEEDLMSNNAQSKIAALEALKMVLHKCEQNIPSNIYKLMKNCCCEGVKPLVLERLRTQVTTAIKNSSVNVTDMFTMEGANEDHEYVIGIFGEAFVSLPSDVLKKLLCDVIIPEIFNITLDRNVRDTVIDVGFQLIEKFPITNLNNYEIKLFTSKVIDRYTKVLEKLREENYSRWHDLWIFLVRFSAKHLHVAMDLANKLLRVVEYAFRNPSYEQRLKGYDCWKELIDNASLDMNHMCSNKQIKLLVTPLRAKFSKMEVVICKRFEVFLYLLEKLQNQSVLCLNEFLEFCFGVSNHAINSSKNGQGKLVPNLWLKSIQVFLAILGDQTHISAVLNRTLFEGPIINESNIGRFDQVVVFSVIECSIILKHISMTEQEKITNFSSLWEALFNILVNSSPEIQEKCFQTIFGSISTIFKDFNEEFTYIGFFSAFTQLLDSSIDYRLISDSLKLLLEYSLKFLGEKDVSEEFFQPFCELVRICCRENNVMEFLVEQLKKMEPTKNESQIYRIWSTVGVELIIDPDNQSRMTAQFFLWPVYHLHQFSGQIPEEVCSKWVKLYVQVSETSDMMKKNIVNELEKTFKSNPLLSSNIASLIAEISRAEIDFSLEFVKAVLKLMSNIMSLPLLSQESAAKMYGMILKCTNVVTVFSTEDIDSEIVHNICQCVEKLPSHQKNLVLLEALEKLVNKIIPNTNASMGKRLKNLLSNFSGVDVQRKASKISTLLSPQEATNGLPISNLKRSIRMTQMAFDKPNLKTNKDKVNALQFFGKDIETMSPLKVKGSVLQNHRTPSPNSRSKKMVNSVKKQHVPEPPLIEEQTCEFAVINTEVKLQKDKLTEHQKEELKRRREDIPALYQDLSQSQNQSQSLTANSKDTLSNLPDQKVETENTTEKNTNLELEDSRNESSSINFVEYQRTITREDETPESDMHNTGNFSAFRKLDDNDSNTDSNDSINKKNNRKSIGKIEKELMKIQMNIVGGDTFLKNLPSKRPRKVIEKVVTSTTPKKPKATDEIQKMYDKEQKHVQNTVVANNELIKSVSETNEHESLECVKESSSPPNLLEKKDVIQSEENVLNSVVTEKLSLPAKPNVFEKPSISEKPSAVEKPSASKTDIMISETQALDNIDSAVSSNNRKKKFIKPKKHVDSLKSEKKKVKSESTISPTSKKRSKNEDKPKPKKLKLDKTLKSKVQKEASETSQSEISESEIDMKQKLKKRNKNMNTEDHKKKIKRTSSLSKNEQHSENLFDSEEIINQKNLDNQEMINGNIQIIEKPKKRPKEIMKKNKEKVRTIQSQLKLANLKDLSDSSETKKAKGAKLIFIREITNSKNVQNAKVSAAGLKRNKDKKSTNIAYTIESPAVHIDLTTLDADTINTQSSTMSAHCETEKDRKEDKPPKKRKRTNSGNSSSSPSNTSSSACETSPKESETKNVKQGKLKRKTIPDIKVPKVPDSPNTMQIKTNIRKSCSSKVVPDTLENPSVPDSKQKLIKATSPKISPAKSLFSPDSPSRVTRSRALSLSPMDANEERSNSKALSMKGVKSLFVESEDIIESSQDSFIESTSVSIGNLSKSRIKPRKVQSTPLKCGTIKDIELLPKEEANVDQILKTAIPNAVADETTSLSGLPKTNQEEISQADTETCESNYEPLPSVVQIELPERPELTDSEKVLSATDTVSIASQTSEDKDESKNKFDVTGDKDVLTQEINTNEIISDTAEISNDVKEENRESSPISNPIEIEFIGTPEKFKLLSGDLPGSPTTNVTPTLTKELLDNTLNISPISSQVAEEPDKKLENDIVKDLDKAIDECERPDESNVKTTKFLNDSKSDKMEFSVNLRSSKLLNMVNVQSPVSHRRSNRKILSSPAPGKSRYEKLFSFVNINKDEEVKTDKKEDFLTCTENEGDMLTFSREVPSPFAVPSSSILKRKLEDTDDGFSPCAKRKRVNFSYPCISSTKLYIRHKEELNTHFRPSYPQNLFGDDDDDSEDEDPFATPKDEQLESEESMDVSNSLLLCKKKPIYEPLVDCEENLNQLWNRLSSPMFSEVLKRVLKRKNINTVGDLARLDEVDINRLPFKQPRVKSVRKTLNYYYTNILKKSREKAAEDADSESFSSGNLENMSEKAKSDDVDVAEDGITEAKMSETNSVQLPMKIGEEFNIIMRRIKNEKVPLEEFGAIFLDLVDESEVISLLKSVYNTDFRKFFEKSHWRYLIETIVQSGGTTDMFDIISDLAETNQIFADQLESIVQLRIEQNPLKDIVSKRTLVELKDALEDCISNNVFERENVLQTCLMPLIRNPNDIKIYFKTLTIVQIHDLFVERVQASDLSIFLEQIKESYGNYTIAQCANRKDVLKICSREELLSSLVEKESEVQTVKDLVVNINDQKKLIELYSYIGNLIPLKCRIDSHIEFLKSIANDSDNVK